MWNRYCIRKHIRWYIVKISFYSLLCSTCEVVLIDTHINTRISIQGAYKSDITQNIYLSIGVYSGDIPPYALYWLEYKSLYSTIAQISVAVPEMGFSGIKAIKKVLSTKSVPKTIFNMSKILLCYVVKISILTLFSE